MKRITILILFTYLFNCSNNVEVSVEDPVLNKITLFGDIDAINEAIESNTLKTILKSSVTNTLEITCYDGSASNPVNPKDPIRPDDGSDGNGNYYRYFNTHTGDLYISNDSDPDAVYRVEIIGDGPCYSADGSQNSYINVIVENSVNLNWKNAINASIQEWNDAINNNPNNGNNLHPDNPHLFFRLAQQSNTNDYGNITIWVEPDSYFIYQSEDMRPVALAGLGSYRILSNGVYVHNIGDRIKINEYYNNYDFQKSITAMVHEMGHTLGFFHTDQNAPNIAGTSQSINSFMNSRIRNGWDFQGFYDEDLLAIDRIFNVQTDWIIMNCENFNILTN